MSMVTSRRPLEKKKCKQLGLSLPEILVALGIMSISIAGVTTVYLSAVEKKIEVDQFSSINQRRAEIIALLRNERAFLNTVRDPINRDFQCLRDKLEIPNTLLNCPDVNGAIYRIRGAGNDVAMSFEAGQGFTRSGASCSGYGSNSDCIFRFDLTWMPKCVGEQCLAPDLLISGELRVSDQNLLQGLFRIDYFKFNIYQSFDETGEAICEVTGLGRHTNGRCSLRLTDIKCDNPDEYLVGFNGDGSVRCESRTFPVCASGYIYGVSAEGEALCDSRTCL